HRNIARTRSAGSPGGPGWTRPNGPPPQPSLPVIISTWLSCCEHNISMLTLPYILLIDLLDYWMHRALHTPLFWHQHAWHHAPKVIYWISGLRTSPGQIVIRIIPSTIFAAFISFEQFVDIGIFFLIFFTLSQHFIHSNMRGPYEQYI
ncbi:sterol desaturase family protein, partial [Cellvibrio sp.]